jgi:uncharacterized protein (DUF2267 family)
VDAKKFVERVSRRLRCDEERAEGVILGVFQNLRDRLTPKEAADVAAQMPAGLRHLWEDNDRPGRAVEKTHRVEFIGRVRRFAGLPDDGEAERAVLAVFSALQALLGSPSGTEGEAWDVFSQLPKDLKDLWLAAGGESGAA